MVWKERRWWWFSSHPSMRSLVSFPAIPTRSLLTIASIPLLCELRHFAAVRFPWYRVSAVSSLRVISLWFSISQDSFWFSIPLSSQSQVWIFIILGDLVPVNKTGFCSSALNVHSHLSIFCLHLSSSAFILSLSQFSISLFCSRNLVLSAATLLYGPPCSIDSISFQHFDLFTSPPGLSDLLDLLDLSIDSYCFSDYLYFIFVSIGCTILSCRGIHLPRFSDRMFPDVSLRLFHVVLNVGF